MLGEMSPFIMITLRKDKPQPKIDGRMRYWVRVEDDKQSQRTAIFMVHYLGQCGCGFSRKVTRKIELKETHTLDDLHEAIIYLSFGWDDPHMYSFFFDNRPYSKNKKMEYSSDPEADDSSDRKPNSSNTKIKDLKLKKNQKFLFIFDFGDDHQFGINVEGFGKVMKGDNYPAILEEKGKSPKQYP